MKQVTSEIKWKRMGEGLVIGPGLKLSYRHRAFVAEYIKCWDETKAARAVGYKNAKVSGHNLVSGKTSPHVAEAIRRLTVKNEEKAIITSEEIMHRLTDLVKSEITDAFTQGWAIVSNPKDIPKVLRQNMKKVRYDAFETVDENGDTVTKYKVEFDISDKLKATELLMKSIGMFAPEQLNVKHGLDWDTLFDRMNDAADDKDVIDAEIKKISG